MENIPSTNGVRSNLESYNDNSHSGLEKHRRKRPDDFGQEVQTAVKTNNPSPSTPSPRGHA